MKWLPDESIARLIESTESPDLSQTRYSILKEIGQGGMGRVYLALDAELNREVALKVLATPDPSGELAARMLAEAKIIARLEHPGIVPLHDAGTLPDGRVFYVMKFVRGERLDAFAHETELIPRLRVFQKICDAVAFAHSEGVIHRDLKPENIMVGKFGEVLVMDWGLAKLLASPESPDSSEILPGRTRRSTDHGAVMGTPGYMSPEQRRGEIEKIGEQSDIYSLGAILHFLISGKGPKRLAAICTKAMSEAPQDRYRNAQELADDIERFLEGASVIAYRENILEKAERWIRKNYFFVILVVTYLFFRVLLLLLSGR
jgi:serine/threonine-protein kinase